MHFVLNFILLENFLANQIQYIKRTMHHDQLGLPQKHKAALAFENQTVKFTMFTEKPYHHLNRCEKGDAIKAFEKIQYQLGTKKQFLKKVLAN